MTKCNREKGDSLFIREACSESNASYFMMLEADTGDTAVEIERSHQYSIAFCCCVTDGSRGTARQNGVSHGKEHEVKVGH